jgi:chromosome condensin MukBEF ATPase and DNA-binding subunit MukB
LKEELEAERQKNSDLEKKLSVLQAEYEELKAILKKNE